MLVRIHNFIPPNPNPHTRRISGCETVRYYYKVMGLNDSLIQMVKVSENIMEAFDTQRVIPMATVNKDGVPNVIYVAIWWWENDKMLCVVNNYLNKTLQNLVDTGLVSFVCYGKNGSFQIKCKAINVTEGPLYEKGHKMAMEREKPLPGKSTIVCKVNEVYQGSGGKGAGDKLA